MENLKKGDVKNIHLPLATREGSYINEYLIIKDKGSTQIWKHLNGNEFVFVSESCGFVDISNSVKIEHKK